MPKYKQFNEVGHVHRIDVTFRIGNNKISVWENVKLGHYYLIVGCWNVSTKHRKDTPIGVKEADAWAQKWNNNAVDQIYCLYERIESLKDEQDEINRIILP